MSSAPEVLQALSADLDKARKEAGRALDKAQALATLLDLADSIASGLNQTTLTVEEFHADAGTELEKAELAALLARAFTETNNEEN